MSAARGKQALRLWLGVLGCANLIERPLRARLRREFGVTLPQFDVLAELARDGGAELSMSALSRRLMVSNGNVTAIVERLVRDGLVERRTASEDRRVQRIALTATGRRRFTRIARAHQGWVEELLEGLPGAEIDALVEALRALRATVRRNVAEPGSDHRSESR